MTATTTARRFADLAHLELTHDGVVVSVLEYDLGLSRHGTSIGHDGDLDHTVMRGASRKRARLQLQPRQTVDRPCTQSSKGCDIHLPWIFALDDDLLLDEAISRHLAQVVGGEVEREAAILHHVERRGVLTILRLEGDLLHTGTVFRIVLDGKEGEGAVGFAVELAF